MAVASLPFYSTSYGETFGYNERDGGNTAVFRNRYDRAGYRGTADLGPTRFNATRAQTTQNLAMTNTQRPQSSLPRQQVQQQQQQTQQRSAAYRSASASATSSSFSPPAQRFEHGGVEETPRGVYTAQANGNGQSQRFASSARFVPDHEPSVLDRPYYVAPYDVPPSHQFAPEARALGNKTYAFETQNPNYAFSQSFRGKPQESSRPLQDPGQSIPYGRLQAENAADVRLKMSLDSWDTFHAYDRNGQINYNLSGLRSKMPTKQDQENYCKGSISRRLEPGAQMRYHIPSYCGFIPTAQFRHGSTYGKTTRLSLAGSQVGL